MSTCIFFQTCMFRKKCMLAWNDLHVDMVTFMLTWNFLHVNMPVNANMLFFPNMHVQKKMHVGMKWLTCWHGDLYVDMKFFACQHAIFSQHACSEKIACWHAKNFMSRWKSHVNMQVTCQHAAPFPDAMIAALFAPSPAPRVARPSSVARTFQATDLATSLLSCVTSWKPTTSSLSGFSRPTTFLPTTCRMVMLLTLCSRLIYLTCLNQLPLTPTHLVRTIPWLTLKRRTPLMTSLPLFLFISLFCGGSVQGLFSWFFSLYFFFLFEVYHVEG